MKILHILNSNRYSGAENVVCQIINLFKNDQDVEMIYVSPDGPIREALEDRNVKFSALPKMTPSALKKIIKNENPDVVYAHDMRAGVFTALACGKIPLILHIHNNAFDSRRISIKSLAFLIAAKKAKHIFWVSQTALDGYRFNKYVRKKSSVLYNIVDIEALNARMNLDPNVYDYDVVYVGRLTSPKNPLRLMSVCRLICDKQPNVKIAVIGTGEMDEETRAKASELKLNDNVSFLGYCPNPLKILHDSKVMIMTSRWEGTPMCALEAMSLGVPIVSTPTDGLVYLIEGSDCGYLSDDDEELANFIAEIITDKEKQSRLSENARLRACKINDTKMYKEKIKTVL